MEQIFNSDFIEARLREHKAWQDREAQRLANKVYRLTEEEFLSVPPPDGP